MKLPAEIAHKQLDEYRQQFEAGEADALFLALLFCAKYGLLMPDWLDWELHQVWHRFIKREADNLGDAFGITWPKGKHKSAYLKRRRLTFAVYSRVQELCRDKAIGDALFEEVGEEFNIGKTLASEYYYAAKRLVDNPPIAARLLIEPYISQSLKR